MRPKSFLSIKQATFDNTMNSTMYLRKNYTLSTRITRQRWARRKHLYGWLALANILKDWAHMYRFYRNYNKVLLNQFLTKSSFVAFNLLSVKNAIPCTYKDSETFLVGTFTRRILNYFKGFNNPRLNFFLSFKNVNLSVVSYLNPVPRQLPLNNYPFLIPLLPDELKTYEIRLNNQLTRVEVFSSLLETVFRLIRNKVIYAYKLLVLLALHRIFIF